jgi:hypothetical protein
MCDAPHFYLGITMSLQNAADRLSLRCTWAQRVPAASPCCPGSYSNLDPVPRRSGPVRLAEPLITAAPASSVRRPAPMMPQLAHAGRRQWPDLNCAANLQQGKRTAPLAGLRKIMDGIRSRALHSTKIHSASSHFTRAPRAPAASPAIRVVHLDPVPSGFSTGRRIEPLRPVPSGRVLQTTVALPFQ